MKPHKGRIVVHKEWPCPGKGLGYAYICTFLDHPEFFNQTGNTSWVVKSDCDLPRHREDGYEIETRNSRYTVVPALPDPVQKVSGISCQGPSDRPSPGSSYRG